MLCLVFEHNHLYICLDCPYDWTSEASAAKAAPHCGYCWSYDRAAGWGEQEHTESAVSDWHTRPSNICSCHSNVSVVIKRGTVNVKLDFSFLSFRRLWDFEVQDFDEEDAKPLLQLVRTRSPEVVWSQLLQYMPLSLLCKCVTSSHHIWLLVSGVVR